MIHKAPKIPQRHLIDLHVSEEIDQTRGLLGVVRRRTRGTPSRSRRYQKFFNRFGQSHVTIIQMPRADILLTGICPPGHLTVQSQLR